MGPVPLLVNYDLPFLEAVSRGHFDLIDDVVNEKHFPRNGHRGIVRAFGTVIEIGERASTEEILADFKKRNLRIAGPHDVLAFASIFPEAQRNREIVELEAVWIYGPGGYRLHMCLNGDSLKRKLGVTYAAGYTWDAGTQFLGVST